MTTKRIQRCQGDLMFIKLDEELWDVEENDPQPQFLVDGKIVIETGEKTGHAHVIDAEKATCALVRKRYSKTNSWDAMGGRRSDLPRLMTGDNQDMVSQLFVKVPSVVTHEEHEPLPLEKGVWVVHRQRQMDYDAFSPRERFHFD